MDRPPPDPVKLLSAWAETVAGEVTPGRGLSNLKTGGLAELLANASDDDRPGDASVASEAAAGGSPPSPLVEAWTRWERGESPPAVVVADLAAGGLQPLLGRLAAEA